MVVSHVAFAVFPKPASAMTTIITLFVAVVATEPLSTTSLAIWYPRRAAT
jgi:hypothetical protein